MARRGPKKKPTELPNYDPEGFWILLSEYLNWMQVRNFSNRTIDNRRKDMRYFFRWAEERSLFKPVEITRPILERYQRSLYQHKKPDGGPLSFRAQFNRLSSVRAYFRYLTRQNYLLYNPASEIELPKVERRLPKHILSISEVEQVINQTDVKESLGIRDRAVLETLYSTGIRRTELIHLKLYDVDRDRGTIMIRQGKHKKDRMIPIGERALHWIRKYLDEVRPSLVLEPDEGSLFLTASGEPFSGNRLSGMVKTYVDAANLEKKGSCHLFRHTMATLMLENGADTRFIQAMLGHASISTTDIYTQVSIRKLKEVHTATHPAKMKKISECPPSE